MRDPGFRAQRGAGVIPSNRVLPRLAACGLALAAVLPPLALAARPGDGGAMPLTLALIGLLLLAPAAVGLVTALCGIGEFGDNVERLRDHEHEQAVLRVFVCLGMFAYGFVLTVVRPGDGAVAAGRVAASLGLAAAWVMLLWAVADPVPSIARRAVAALADAVLLSAFLAVGGEAAASWFPLYLLATFYAGFRFGPIALATQASLSLAGFAAAVALTPFWRQQPLLTAGLIVALAALPAYVGGLMRAVTAARAEAMAARAARRQFLTTIRQALRGPLEALAGATSAAGDPAPSAVAALPSARALLIEAGVLEPVTEAFDLHRILNDALDERRGEAAVKGLNLRLSIDPALPYRLRGWKRELRQIIDCLLARGIDAAATGTVRVAVDAAGRDRQILHLRLTVLHRTTASAAASAVGGPSASKLGDDAPLALDDAGRLAQLMGGCLAATGARPTATVPLTIDEPAVDGEVDLAGCTVLIAAEENELAGDVMARVKAWHGDPRRIEGFEGGFEAIDRRGAAQRALLIVDGTARPLAALSFAHRAVNSPSPPTCVLFIAAAAQTEGVIDLAEGELDGILPAPFDVQLFANALHALPLWPTGTAPSAAGDQSHVMPIAAHPRFAADTPTVDAAVVAALRNLDGGDAFLGEIVESFRDEARALLERLADAAMAADVPGFIRGLNALRSCAASLGATRLCELLLSLRGIAATELREGGGPIVQRLRDEVARLDAALADFLPEPREARG